MSIVLEALFERVGLLRQERSIDIVCFSGDLAFQGRREDYEFAGQTFLEPLLEVADIKLERFFCVPGNHDVDRKTIDAAAEDLARRSFTDRATLNEAIDSPNKVAAARQRLEEYDAFITAHCAQNMQPLELGMGWATRVPLRGHDVGIAGLDSAWRSSGDADRAHLLVSERQVDDAIQRLAGAPLKLILVHHPLHWLAEFDHLEVTRRLMCDADIVLSGHLHLPDPVISRSPAGTCLFSSAGAIFEGRRLNGFTVIDVDPEAKTGSIKLWRYYDERRSFGPDLHTAAEGVFEFSLTSRMSDPTTPDYSWVVESLEVTPANASSTTRAAGTLIQALAEGAADVDGAAWILALALDFTRLVPARGSLADSRFVNGDKLAAVDSAVMRQMKAVVEFGKAIRGELRWLSDLLRELRLLATEFRTVWSDSAAQATVRELDAISRALIPRSVENLTASALLVRAEELIGESRYLEAVSLLQSEPEVLPDRRTLLAEAYYRADSFEEVVALLSRESKGLTERELEWLIWSLVETGATAKVDIHVARHTHLFSSANAKIFRDAVRQRMALRKARG